MLTYWIVHAISRLNPECWTLVFWLNIWGPCDFINLHCKQDFKSNPFSPNGVEFLCILADLRFKYQILADRKIKQLTCFYQTLCRKKSKEKDREEKTVQPQRLELFWLHKNIIRLRNPMAETVPKEIKIKMHILAFSYKHQPPEFRVTSIHISQCVLNLRILICWLELAVYLEKSLIMTVSSSGETPHLVGSISKMPCHSGTWEPGTNK